MCAATLLNDTGEVILRPTRNTSDIVFVVGLIPGKIGVIVNVFEEYVASEFNPVYTAAVEKFHPELDIEEPFVPLPLASTHDDVRTLVLLEK